MSLLTDYLNAVLAMAGAGSILLQSMHTAALIGVSVVFSGLTIRRLTREG